MLRFLRRPLPPRHAPHVHRCRDCTNLHVCQDADRCRVPNDWLCATCGDAIHEQQITELARHYEKDAE